MYKKSSPDQQTLKERFEIALLSDNYMRSKRLINEYEENIIDLSENRLEIHRRIVHHIEYAVEALKDKERFIVEYEVLRGKTGKWYKGYMSVPTYYRYRASAYHNFLRSL